ncbi:Clp protease N-terminal domain-containing protein [Pseudorhodoplanes sp.]|uniref:Clp protease N-terminal domain-containing protein n=1 Tax=Pseudorhodoplanes sp. TaxID=1934341 RepID=UPI00391C301A
MNTYQSPYIDGQVLGSETPAPRREDPLPVPQAEAKIHGCTKSASECLHKTTKLAREFNHGTVSAAHLILAMTLIPNASRQFELRKMDIDRAFRAAMNALMDIERGSASTGALPVLSEEFNVIVTLAQELARNRDNQEVSVDDLLTALDRLPIDSSAAQLVRGEKRSGQAAPDIQSAFDELTGTIHQQYQELRQVIDMLRLDLQSDDVTRLKEYLQQRDGAIEQIVRKGFAELGQKLSSPVSDAAEPALAPPSVTAGGEENSLWEKIFGRKAPEAPAAQPEVSPAQTRWGM